MRPPPLPPIPISDKGFGFDAPLRIAAFSLVIVWVVCMLFGCTTEKAHFVPPGVPVRLGEPIRGVRVFVPSANGLVAAKADLYPGMWITVDPAEWPLSDREAAMNLERSEPK
jgi:hypothetical protein